MYYYQAPGAKKRPLGSDKALALRQWAELEAQGVVGAGTFAVVAGHYERAVIPRKAAKTQKEQIAQVKLLVKAFGHAPMSAIRPALIRKYLDKRSAPISANREIALFSHIWNWARSQDYTTAPNPCTGIERNRERPRDVYVTDDAYRRVYAAAPRYVQDAMDLIVITSQRPTSVLQARLGDIQDGELWFGPKKGGVRVRIAVEGPLAAFVDRVKARTPASLYLVADERGQRVTLFKLDHAFARARNEVGETWELRDLRKKAITDEPDLTVASQRAGHSDEMVTATTYRLVKGRKVKPGRGV